VPVFRKEVYLSIREEQEEASDPNAELQGAAKDAKTE
jgi:sRNA-binding carbon storage regulator CsrA